MSKLQPSLFTPLQPAATVDLILLAYEPGIALQTLMCIDGTIPTRVHVLGGTTAAHLRLSRRVHSFRHFDFGEGVTPEAFVTAIESFAATTGAKLVLPGDDRTTRLLVHNRAHLSVPTFPLPSVEAYEQLVDKWSFFETCLANQVPVPATVRVGGSRHDVDVEALGVTFGYPLVVKPTDQGNNNGVVIARSAAQLRAEVTDNERYGFGNLIAQSFIPGIDVDCSVLAVDGVVLALAVQTRMGHMIVFGENHVLAEHVSALMRATRYSGVAHMDARLDERDGSIKLIECNPRFWASINAARCCGVNFVMLGILAALRGTDQPAAPTRGTYLSWSALISEMAHLKFGAARSVSAWKGFAQMATDPLPALYEEWYALKRRMQQRRMFARPSRGQGT